MDVRWSNLGFSKGAEYGKNKSKRNRDNCHWKKRKTLLGFSGGIIG